MSEHPSCYVHTTRKARLAHKCCECGGTIQPSETYHVHSGIWDSEPSRFKHCPECEQIMKDIQATPGFDDYEGIDFTNLIEHVAEADPQIMLRFINNATARGKPPRQWLIDRCNKLLNTTTP